MLYVLLLNKNGIATTKAINHLGILFPNEIEISEEQYNEIDEFPLKITIEDRKVVSWKKTEIPYEEPIIVPHKPAIEERLQQAEDTLLFLLNGGM